MNNKYMKFLKSLDCTEKEVRRLLDKFTKLNDNCKIKGRYINLLTELLEDLLSIKGLCVKFQTNLGKLNKYEIYVYAKRLLGFSLAIKNYIVGLSVPIKGYDSELLFLLFEDLNNTLVSLSKKCDKLGNKIYKVYEKEEVIWI